MTSLIRLPHLTEAFSEYRPSQNAHTDFLGPNALGKRKETDKSGPRVVKLNVIAPPLASTSDQLKDVLSAIPLLLNGQKTPQSFHHLSATCHRLVSGPHYQGEAIYLKIKSEMEQVVSVLARQLRGGVMGRQASFLKDLVDGWKTWETRVNLLSAVYVYLDRMYSSVEKAPSIMQLAIEAFRNGVWNNDILADKRKTELLAWAASERSQAQPDASLRSTIASLSTLSKLLDTFYTMSEPFTEATGWHYSEMADTHVASLESGTMSSTRYVEWALEQVEEERERAKSCFDADVAQNVISIVRTETGTRKKSQVVRKALDEAMDGTDQSALGRLYRFSVDCEIFKTLVESLQAHVQHRLKTLISDPANDAQMIDGTLTLKRFADQALKHLFEQGDVEMTDGESPVPNTDPMERVRVMELEDAVRTGFKAGIGSRQNAPAEWIAKHLDVAMRKGQGSGTEAAFNSLLDEIIALVGFTPDKDVFKAFYSTQLAKRLLLNKSASDDMERNMIVKLQKEMGEEFTSGDIMMKDLAVSETLVKSYQQAQSKNPDDYRDPGQFTANVLTQSAWPAYPLLKDGWNFKLTPDLQTSIDQFTKWYATQHKNRQLSWRWQLATVSLTARFPSGRYEVGVSLFQAVALMQFNDDDALSYTELHTRTGIEKSELVRTLQSLSMGRKGTRVLVKKPAGKEVNPDDTFAWNKAFTSDRIKFRINQIQQDMSAEESKKTNEQVAIDRVSVLEATIVRIMKGKKKMTLQLLVDAVVTDVSKRFPPDVKEIKRRMESLIEREFLMRDEDDRNLLHYLA